MVLPDLLTAIGPGDGRPSYLREHLMMRRTTITQIANELLKRRDMAYRLKCSERTIDLFERALVAANAIDLPILEARWERRETARS